MTDQKIETNFPLFESFFRQVEKARKAVNGEIRPAVISSRRRSVILKEIVSSD